MLRGYEYGYNRLIVGYHWATDIEATRQLSTALVARLNASPAFRSLVSQARTEYLRLSGHGTRVASLPATGNDFSRAYHIDGTPATGHTRGIVIRANQKVVKAQ